MKKVLCIINSLYRGGAETFMVKLCNNIDREKYRIDFCVKRMEEGAYEPLLRELGSKIFHTEMRTKKPIKCFFDILKIVKNEKYENVLVVSEQSINVLDIIAAKLGGAKKCSMRSTNANLPSKRLNQLHKILKPLSIYIPDVMLAPSSEAGEFTFGKRNIKKGKVHLLNNGLQYEKYEFSSEKRSDIRKAFNIEEKLVIGHVGRFSEQKNHTFLIDVFAEILKANENAVLLLIGTGEKQQELLHKVQKLGIAEKVIFAGTRDDVPVLLSAMDLMVFPSLYEGMPNVVIEAQAAGLPVVASDSITKEADITGLVKYIPLEKNAKEWAHAALEHIKLFERRSYKDEFYTSGYDIKAVTERFIELVF